MSFWQSERFEYLRQPHILALSVLGLAVIGAAVYTGVSRLSDRGRLMNLPAVEACAELVGDAELCRFAAASQAGAGHAYHSVTTGVDDAGSTTITQITAESADRLRTITQVDGRETDAFMLLDADNYVRDYADGGIWAHYHDDAFEPSPEVTSEYDFSSASSPDVIEFRDQYIRHGEEDCGELTCLKYEILSTDGSSEQTFIWFDTTDFQLRRYQFIGESGTQMTQYDYNPTPLSVPTPTKTVDEETFLKLLGTE